MEEGRLHRATFSFFYPVTFTNPEPTIVYRWSWLVVFDRGYRIPRRILARSIVILSLRNTIVSTPMDREAFRELRKLNVWQVPAWIVGYCLYVSKVVLVTCVSKDNVLGSAVGAFVLVAAIEMDNTQRKETLVELVKAMQQDVPSAVAWGWRFRSVSCC